MRTGYAWNSRVARAMAVRAREKALPFLCAANLVACAGSSDDPELPAGWEDAKEIPVTTTECDSQGDDDAPASTFTFELSEDEESVDALYTSASARCGQRKCAYHLEEDGVAKILTQPCEMHPEDVPRCVCDYNLSFTFDAPPSGEVEIWVGSDAYAGPAEQRLVYEGPVVSPAEE